jgi:hypothetical protein
LFRPIQRLETKTGVQGAAKAGTRLKFASGRKKTGSMFNFQMAGDVLGMQTDEGK